jgi:hypothetical protein
MPGDQHESRVTILDALGLMAGFSRRVARLPDLSMPDVIRFDPSCGAMFIGEAKDTETAGRSDTYDRLLGYMKLFDMRLKVGLRGSVFALCVPENAADGWISTLAQIAAHVRPAHSPINVWPVPEGAVLWLQLSEVEYQPPVGHI